MLKDSKCSVGVEEGYRYLRFIRNFVWLGLRREIELDREVFVEVFGDFY